jgi:hypothetical protein
MPSMVQQKWLRHLPPAPTKTKPNYVADIFAFPSAIRWVPHPTTLGFLARPPRMPLKDLTIRWTASWMTAFTYP